MRATMATAMYIVNVALTPMASVNGKKVMATMPLSSRLMPHPMPIAVLLMRE